MLRIFLAHPVFNGIPGEDLDYLAQGADTASTIEAKIIVAVTWRNSFLYALLAPFRFIGASRARRRSKGQEEEEETLKSIFSRQAFERNCWVCKGFICFQYNGKTGKPQPFNNATGHFYMFLRHTFFANKTLSFRNIEFLGAKQDKLSKCD